MNKIWGFLIFLLFISVSGYTQDLRLQIADRLEITGRQLQRIQDQESFENASQKFNSLFNHNLSLFWDASRLSLDSLTSEESTSGWVALKSIVPQSERSQFILEDRTLSDKEKMLLLLKEFIERDQSEILKNLKDQALSRGFQKVFQDMAQVMRSRTRYQSLKPNPNWRAIILLSCVFIVEITVETPMAYWIATPLIFLVGYLEFRDFYEREAYDKPVQITPIIPPSLMDSEEDVKRSQ